MNLDTIFPNKINALIIPSGHDNMLVLDENFREEKITSTVDEYLEQVFPDFINDKNEKYEFSIPEEVDNIQHFLLENNLNDFNNINYQEYFKPYPIIDDSLVLLSYYEYKTLILNIIKTINPFFLLDKIKNFSNSAIRKIVFTDITTEKEISLFDNPVLLLNVEKVDDNKYELIHKKLNLDPTNQFVQNLTYKALEELNKNNNPNNFNLHYHGLDFYVLVNLI